MHWDTLKQGNCSTVRGDGGSKGNEVRAGTTSPMPEHKGFMLQPGGGTSYVGQSGMLGYTWVIFEKFSVLFPRDGYLFFNKISALFCKVGIYFEEKFCICRTRWNPFTKNFLYFIPQSCCILHIKFLYIST